MEVEGEVVAVHHLGPAAGQGKLGFEFDYLLQELKLWIFRFACWMLKAIRMTRFVFFRTLESIPVDVSLTFAYYCRLPAHGFGAFFSLPHSTLLSLPWLSLHNPSSTQSRQECYNATLHKQFVSRDLRIQGTRRE